MGVNKKWGEGFAAWLTSLPVGIKFIVALFLALSTIVPAGLIVSVIVPLIWESDRSNEISIKCGDRSITVNMDDPIYDPNNLEASAARMCDLAWGRA